MEKRIARTVITHGIAAKHLFFEENIVQRGNDLHRIVRIVDFFRHARGQFVHVLHVMLNIELRIFNPGKGQRGAQKI